MKYGLSKGDKLPGSKKRWRIVMENEMTSLKQELSLLKEQLHESLDKIILLSATNSSLSSVPKGGEEKNNPICNNDNNNNVRNDDFICKFSMCVNNESKVSLKTEAEIMTCAEQLSRSYGLKKSVGEFTGTKLRQYHPTRDMDPLTKVCSKHHCISRMPEYSDKSFEELRLEDYILKMRFKDTKSRSARSQRKMVSVRRTNFRKNSGSKLVPYGTNVAPEKTEGEKFQSPSQSFSWTPKITQSDDGLSKLMIKVDGTKLLHTGRHEDLLSEVLFKLNNMDTNLSTMKWHLNTMDSHLSEINSRVSVMDSKLSTVNMFVTMQRVDKVWHDLEPRLASLESRVAEPPSNETIIVSTREVQEEIKPTSTEENIDSPSTHKTCSSSIHAVATMCATELLSEHDSSNTELCASTKDISQDAPVDPLDTSFDCELEKEMNASKSSQINMTVTPVFNSEIVLNDTFVQENKLRNDHTAESLSFSVQNNDQIVLKKSNVLDNEVGISSKISSVKSSENSAQCLSACNNEAMYISSLNSDSCSKNESKVFRECRIPRNQESSIEIELKNLCNEETTSDLENDYVIVKKSDLVDLSEQETTQCTLITESSSETKDFQVCNDITEYLEVNLGKKKDLVYEFGFEANADLRKHSSPFSTTKEGFENELDRQSAARNPVTYKRRVRNYIRYRHKYKMEFEDKTLNIADFNLKS